MTPLATPNDPFVDGLLARIAELEAQLAAESSLLNWLEDFLQAGSEHAVSTRHESEYRSEDDPRYRNPFSVGYEVETEHRGCYRWQELSKGEKRLRAALTTARAA